MLAATMAEKTISAQKKDKRARLGQRETEGPTVFTLARKADILGDHIVGTRQGKPRLARYHIADAADILSWAVSRMDKEGRPAPLITQAEYWAGSKLCRLRRMLWGVGVVPAPSFFRAMVAESSSTGDEEADQKREGREEMTEEDRQAILNEAAGEYEQAMSWLRMRDPAAEAILHNLACGDWWPETQEQFGLLKFGLAVLARNWKLEDVRDKNIRGFGTFEAPQ